MSDEKAIEEMRGRMTEEQWADIRRRHPKPANCGEAMYMAMVSLDGYVSAEEEEAQRLEHEAWIATGVYQWGDEGPADWQQALEDERLARLRELDPIDEQSWKTWKESQ